ncbi:AP-4 complex subunit mu, putative [Hepatocystis sp. ex Piliocolobus tephrosceles]|nr:AP-4 complex subunit mu, putative [Hepatocystis sp. ex Piliocolobus tephrosceles]
MVISQFYILSSRGDTIINRNFRSDITKGSIELFYRNVKCYKNGDPPPLFYLNGINFIFIKNNNLYFVMTSLFNVSPSYLLELLHRLLKIIRDFCGQVTEDIIRTNFILVYEIIDEIIYYGYLQNSNTEYIKNLIHNEVCVTNNTFSNNSNNSSDSNNKKKIFPSNLPKFSLKHSNTLPSNASQHPIQINDRQNEIFIDIIEKINLLMNSKGEIVYSCINGVIQIKSYLNGNPFIKIALNDDIYIKNIHSDNTHNVIIDDCNFNYLVNVSQFEKDKTLSLYQPDGECVLMNYRINNNYKAPFKVLANLIYSPNHTVELYIRVRLDIPSQYSCTNVYVNCKLSKHVTSVHLDSSTNSNLFSTQYIQNENKLLWTIKKFKGENEYSIRSKITLNSNYVYSKRDFGPIHINFEIPMFNLSKVRIKYLRIIENYKSSNTHRWVRYITQSNSYVYRLN